MNWLFYTTKTGSVRSLKITGNKPVEKIERITPAAARDEARRAFIGDNQASGFKVYSSENAPRYPIKSGTGYKTDPVKVQDDLRVVNKKNRDEALLNLAVDVAGKSIQTRPQDEVNLRLAIGEMEPLGVRRWILSDNTVSEVSKEDLIDAYTLGLSAANAIYNTYMDLI